MRGLLISLQIEANSRQWVSLILLNSDPSQQPLNSGHVRNPLGFNRTGSHLCQYFATRNWSQINPAAASTMLRSSRNKSPLTRTRLH